MRHAVVNIATGSVVTVVELSDPATWPVPAGHQIVPSDAASPGDTWNGTTFVKPPAPTGDPVLVAAFAAEAARAETFRADSGRVDLLQRLRTATPAQIDTWVDTNVTSIATARTVLKAIIKVIALDART
jgi:hypothetical protein